jgi:hypothetical protein
MREKPQICPKSARMSKSAIRKQELKIEEVSDTERGKQTNIKRSPQERGVKNVKPII